MKNRLTSLITLTLFALLFSTSAYCSEDEELEAMQQKLNAEVMAKPFLAEEPAKVDAYIRYSLKNNVIPPPYSGIYWRTGYTCHDLLRHSWKEYRNCRYYHRYYGRYYGRHH